MLTFAIGDIHGCLPLLDALLSEIATRAGSEQHRIVCLGDYIDRGPDSAGVIARLRALGPTATREVVCLKGNHEDLMLAARHDPRRNLDTWLYNGGAITLSSFAVLAVQDLSEDVIAWTARCPTSFDDGRRLFVHAGLNPAFALDEQREEDKLWIRGPFLDNDHDFGRFVVHGHTPRLDGRPDVRRWRVNLDTGAVYGGRLTAAIFTDEADEPSGFIQAVADDG